MIRDYPWRTDEELEEHHLISLLPFSLLLLDRPTQVVSPGDGSEVSSVGGGDGGARGNEEEGWLLFMETL